MKKFSLALLAMATALAIAPAAMAATIPFAAGSSFTVAGVILPPPSTVPTLTGVQANGGTNSFSDIVFVSPDLVGNNSTGTLTYSLYSSITGDTFTVTPTDGNVITFTVTSDTVGGGQLGDDAFGYGTLSKTGYTTITNAYWSESVTQAGNISFTFDTTVAPEPSSLLLLGTGLLGLAFVAFRKAKSSGMVLSM